MVYFRTMESPVGALLLAGDGSGLRKLSFRREPAPGWLPDDGRLEPVVEQLAEYFAGARTEFTVAIAPEGTSFQRAVWRELCNIPYGHTTSYGELARRIGTPSASRAVGAANGANPLAIIVPCHRVIGSTGKLVGFGGGIETKQWLLSHERKQSPLYLHPLFKEQTV